MNKCECPHIDTIYTMRDIQANKSQKYINLFVWIWNKQKELHEIPWAPTNLVQSLYCVRFIRLNRLLALDELYDGMPDIYNIYIYKDVQVNSATCHRGEQDAVENKMMDTQTKTIKCLVIFERTQLKWLGYLWVGMRGIVQCVSAFSIYT